jgi:hypothetical protein
MGLGAARGEGVYPLGPQPFEFGKTLSLKIVEFHASLYTLSEQSNTVSGD